MESVGYVNHNHFVIILDLNSFLLISTTYIIIITSCYKEMRRRLNIQVVLFTSFENKRINHIFTDEQPVNPNGYVSGVCLIVIKWHWFHTDIETHKPHPDHLLTVWDRRGIMNHRAICSSVYRLIHSPVPVPTDGSRTHTTAPRTQRWTKGGGEGGDEVGSVDDTSE